MTLNILFNKVLVLLVSLSMVFSKTIYWLGLYFNTTHTVPSPIDYAAYTL